MDTTTKLTRDWIIGLFGLALVLDVGLTHVALRHGATEVFWSQDPWTNDFMGLCLFSMFVPTFVWLWSHYPRLSWWLGIFGIVVRVVAVGNNAYVLATLLKG